jgi:hypothetical protein
MPFPTASRLARHGPEIRALLEARRAVLEPPKQDELFAAWASVEADLKTVCASCVLSVRHQEH